MHVSYVIIISYYAPFSRVRLGTLSLQCGEVSVCSFQSAAWALLCWICFAVSLILFVALEGLGDSQNICCLPSILSENFTPQLLCAIGSESCSLSFLSHFDLMKCNWRGNLGSSRQSHCAPLLSEKRGGLGPQRSAASRYHSGQSV